MRQSTYRQEVVMLESKQHTHLRYFLDFYIPNPINDLVKRCLMELVYFFLPEDTTDNVGCRQNEVNCLEVSGNRSTFKVVLWVVVSITFALAVGQLK